MHYVLDCRPATAHFPGIGRYVSNLARELLPLLDPDERLTLLQTSDQPAIQQLAAPKLTVQHHNFSLKQQREVPKALASLDNPLLHATYYLMPYRPKTRTILTIYDVIPLLYPQYVSPQARLLFQLTTRLAIRASSHLVAISEATKRDFVSKFGVMPDKVSVSPLAVDPSLQPASSAEIERIRSAYNLPDQFLLYLGINKPHKNLVRLIDAYAQLKNAPPLAIAGAWDERYPESKEKMAEHGLEDSILFLGRIAEGDMAALFSAATIFVFPSVYEGFGLPVLEAMACGTPVACGNRSSLPEVAGDAGALFDPLSAESIADTLQTLLDSPNHLQQMAEDGIRQAAKFSWQRTAAQTLAIYRNNYGEL